MLICMQAVACRNVAVVMCLTSYVQALISHVSHDNKLCIGCGADCISVVVFDNVSLDTEIA